MGARNLKFFKDNYQIFYSVALIIFIPLSIIANTVIFTRLFKNNIDQDLYSKAISIGNVINVNLMDVLNDQALIQYRLDQIAKLNQDIKAMDVLTRDGDNFKVAASLDRSIVGKQATTLQYLMSWHQNQPVAFLTNSQSPNTVVENTGFSSTERFWTIIMPLNNAKNEKSALLSMKVSLALMDDLTKQAIIRSYLVLTVTIIIIILLLANNTRLFEYAALYKKLQEVDQMKDEFISVASHELRTPVTGIRGYVSMILEGNMGEVSDQVRSSLKLVEGSSERLSLLVEDLLNVSRIEQGRIEIKPRPMDVAPVIANIVDELKVQAQAKSLVLAFYPHTTPLPDINIDENRLKEILVNVIGNAIKYTAHGGVNITTKVTGSGKDLEIRIKDTGIGMSSKERERLFEKFYRVRSDKTSNIIGTGLGLWITKQMTEMMKGAISVDSIEDVGTEIILSFPLLKNK